jgi:hypothetical protein
MKANGILKSAKLLPAGGQRSENMGEAYPPLRTSRITEIDRINVERKELSVLLMNMSGRQ